jgi:plastocyanin
MRKLVVAGVALLALLAGCGSDNKESSSASGSGSGSGSTPAASTPAASASASGEPAPVTLDGQVTNKGGADLPADGKISMEVDDRYFEPTFVKAKAGQEVTVELESEGEQPHTFTIDAAKVDQSVAAGAKHEVTFTMPASGFLNFYCRFHRGGGMQGAFYIG